VLELAHAVGWELTRYSERVVASQIKLAYDGTRYCGWQLQPGGQPTVQGHLEKALEQLTGCNRKVLGVTGAGRTDSGVHAHMQVGG
jgi:tRNA pseudouridine38-40 synthase